MVMESRVGEYYQSLGMWLWGIEMAGKATRRSHLYVCSRQVEAGHNE